MDEQALRDEIVRLNNVIRELRVNEEKLHGLYELSPLGIARTDMNGRFIEFNEAFRRITGYETDELKHLDYWTLTPRKYDADEARQLESIRISGRYGPYEKEYLRKDGRLAPVQLNGILVSGSDGQRYIWSIIEDITERKRRENAVERERIRLQTILRTASDGIHMLDSDGVLVEANDAFLDMLGYDDSVVGALRVTDWAETSLSDIKARIADLIARQKKAVFEVRHRRRDGVVLDVEISTSAVRFEDKDYIYAASRDITERKRLEQERGQYWKFFQLSTDPMCVADPYGCFKLVNPAFVELTGFSESELLAQPFLEFILPEDRLRTAEEMKLQVSQRPSLRFENRYLRKDGTVIHLSWTGYYDKNDGHTYASARDITALKQAEDALLEARELVDEAQKLSKLGGWKYDCATARVTWTDGVYQIYGVGKDYDPTSVDRNIQFFLEDDRPALKSAFERAAYDGEPFDREARFRRFNGECIWVRATGIPRMDNGQVVSVTGYICDITEGKQIEEALRASEEQMRLFFDRQLVGMAITSPQKGWLKVNDRLCQILGYSREDLGRLTWAEVTHPDDLSADQVQFERLLVGDIDSYFLEKRFIRKDGAVVHTELSIGCVRCLDGSVDYVLALLADITERKRAEQQLRIAATAFESQEGMLITDANSIILQVNQAFTNITGYTAEDVVGKKTSLLKSGHHDSAFYGEMWWRLSQYGVWQGEVWNRRKNGEVFPEWLTITAVKGGDGGVSNYVATLTDITLRKAAEDEIKHLAFYDPLTHLPNRRLLLDRLKQALASSARTKCEGALLFIDLDNFKTLNDTLGHDVGDLLLQQVGHRLSTCVREGDTVARLGGDEFVIMLEDLSPNRQDSASQAQAVGEKILTTLNQPYLLAGQPHHSTPSIGATLFDNHQNSVDELLKRGDLAMYQAKAAGRNTLRFYDPELEAVVKERARLETDLRQGLIEEQFLLYYQPQVDRDGRLAGAEALVRWAHPERGLVYPSEFISLAEETGLILPLGNWVLETACNQMVAWAAHADTAHLTLAVNVSARQLRQPDFAQQVLAVVRRSGADPRKLKLELTESLLLDNVEEVIAKMTVLQEHGIRFSLDDFGTGYSSLSYLKRLPLSQLKIDQSFVRDVLTDPNDAAIAHTIVILAQSLGLTVIAEGVETEEQREFLALHGCHAYQGYLYSQPVTMEKFKEFLNRG